MNILLVNDDGYKSSGIKTLKKLLSKYGHVVIIAPDGVRSGGSASLTLGRPIKLEQVEEDVYKCDGTPVDCVSLGLCCFNADFDIVVSGCNEGQNISYDTMYSSTVGACLEALIFRKPTVAFSAESKDFHLLEKHFDEIWEYINKHNLISDEYLLNINIPHDEVKGIALGTLYYRKDQNYFTKEKDGFYAYRHLQTEFDDQPGSDCYQVTHGIISIVPLSRSYFDKSIYERLQKKLG